MTDSDIKALVRKRDGYRCRDCGMTNDEHVAKYERGLEVHRLLPGSEYSVSLCVTLCRACHGKKPKSVEDAVYSSTNGLIFFFLNHYDSEDRHVLDSLKQEALDLEIPWFKLLDKILREHFDGHTPDYVI